MPTNITEPVVEATETSQQMEFYCVSLQKFLILYIGTLGLYAVYWFFKHWSLFKNSTNATMWPIMRGVFSIFFTHSLFSLFEMKYETKTGEAPKSITNLATIFVVVTLLGNIGAKLSEAGYGLPLSVFSALIALPISCWCLYQAQSLVNYASDDVHGSANNRLTLLNYFWLTLGVLLWALTLLGMYNIPLE